ncbi:MAG: DNA topology modulation protein [Gemmatimonadaceae bacterium]
MERVLVIGAGGSGKTTVARTLAERLGLPLIHLDAHYWRPGWTPTPPDEWQSVVEALVAQPRWVMDGNYGGTLDMRLAACDSVVFLDLPRRVCLWRILKRRTRYRGHTRPDVAPGCPERLTWEFLRWVWTYPKRRRGRILERLRTLTGRRVVILSSQREVERFLATLVA